MVGVEDEDDEFGEWLASDPGADEVLGSVGRKEKGKEKEVEVGVRRLPPKVLFSLSFILTGLMLILVFI